MKNNPFCAPIIRRICGSVAPFIGVFLLLSLVVFNNVALAQEALGIDVSQSLGDAKAISSDNQKNDTSLDQTISPVSKDDKVNTSAEDTTVGTLADDNSSDTTPDPTVQSQDDQTKNDDTTKEDDSNKDDTDSSQALSNIKPSPIITVNDFRSPTLGKYLSPTVSSVDGSLSYEYPISVPSGRNGLAPDIKLAYNSNNKSYDSILGIGWSFNIPYIQRVNKNGTNNIYTSNDYISSLDGTLLNTDGVTYIPRVENGNFLKYKYQNGSWTVYDKSGTRYDFGATAQARHDNPNNSSEVFSWMLEKITDTNGNTISFKYFKDQGQIYPDTISYNQEGKFSIGFSRAPSSQVNKSYITAFGVTTAYRISTITVKIDSAVVEKYSIAYTNSGGNLISGITTEGYDGGQTTTLPPSQFGYGTDDGQKKWNFDPNYILPTDPALNVVTIDDKNSSGTYGNSYLDINGDGLLDIVRWDSTRKNGETGQYSGNQVYLNNGSRFVLDSAFLLPADSNGQVMRLDYTCGIVTTNSPYYGSSFKDINGDGLPDVVMWYAGKTYGIDKGNAVFINTGTGFQFDPNFKLPTDPFGNVLVLDYNSANHFGNSFIDINGDGLLDVVRWTVAQPNGYSTITSGNQVFINTGYGFNIDNSYLLPTDADKGVLVLNFNDATGSYGNSFRDVNGDNIPDIVRWIQGQKNGYKSPSPQNLSGNQVFINTGHGFYLDPNFLLPTNSTSGAVEALESSFGDTWGDKNYGNAFYDINGDGLIDVVRWQAGKLNGYDGGSSGNQVFLNNGRGFILDPNFLLPTDASAKVLTLDFGYATLTSSYNNSFQDINGDGLPDIVRWSTGQPNGYFNPNLTNGNQVYINTGSGFYLDSAYALPLDSSGNVLPLDLISPNSSNRNITLSLCGTTYKDINGDGIPDIVRWLKGSSYGYTSGMYGNQVLLGAVGRKDLRKVTNSAGGKHVFTFKGIKQFVNSQSVGLNSNLLDLFNTFVVSSDTATDGFAKPGTYNYEYSGAFFCPRDKFVGFGETKKTNPDGSYNKTEYFQGSRDICNAGGDSYAKLGKPYEDTLRDKFDNVYSKNLTRYLTKSLPGGASAVLTYSVLNQSYDGVSSHKDNAVSYAYDDYGNTTQKVTLGEVSGAPDGSWTDTGTDDFTENISYALNASKYIVGLSSADALLDHTGVKVRESKFYYDNLNLGQVDIGNETKTENWKSGTHYTSSTRLYNALGLVTLSKDELTNPTSYVYDTANLYPIKITDPLSYKTLFSYDYFNGKPTSITDKNGYVYQTTFDGLGRTTAEKIPDLISPYTPVLKTAYVYLDTPLSTSVKKSDYLNSDNSADIYQYFDGFGKLIQERKEAEIANKYNVRDLVYDNQGMLLKETSKYQGDGSARTSPNGNLYLYTNYSYDPLGRTTLVSTSAGTTNTTFNNWMLSIKDANGKIKNLYKDAYGNLVKVEEKNGMSTYTTYYEWDGNGKLTKITDASNNVRNFKYDALGERIYAEDLHAPANTLFGKWNFTYNDAGNLTQSISPNDEIVDYTYDALGRKLTEDFNGASGVEVAYMYDSCTGGAGKLCAVFKDSANTNYSYNANGSINAENEIIDGTTYSTLYARDRQGNVTSIIYPDSSAVNYVYNYAGLLEKIQRRESGGTLIDVVSNFDYSPMDQVVTEVNQNGTTLTNVYDETKLYRLTKKTIQSLTGVVESTKYTYDALGNILTLEKAPGPQTSKLATYTYDDLSRLTSATVTSTGNSQNYTENYSYDALGNILSKSGITYSYSAGQGSGYANPHAVLGITSPNYTQEFIYDKRGNMTAKKTTSISAIVALSVSPNGKATNAGITGPGIPNGVQNIGSGSSPVPINYSLTNFVPNTNYAYSIIAQNSDGSYGDGFLNFPTYITPKPTVISAFVTNVTKTSAMMGGEVNPNGRSTDIWFEISGVGSSTHVHLDSCDDIKVISPIVWSGLTPGNSYQVRLVAKNEKGINYGDWLFFQTESLPPPPPAIPPAPKYPPILYSLTVLPNAPLSILDNVEYTWDYNGELVGVLRSGSENLYNYDYSGNRVKAAVYNSTGNLYTTYYPNKYYEKSGNDITKYIYAGGVLISTVKKSGTTTTVSFIHSDNLGSTSAVTDSTGAVLQSMDYYPFGSQRICAGVSCSAEKRYVGEYFDVDTTLNYLNARYYDSSLGRFISEDSAFWNPEGFLTDPQSLNSYSYARNNPVILLDANGNMWGWSEWGSFAKGAVIGAATAIVVSATIGAVAAFSPIIATAAVVGLAVYGITEIGSAAYVSAVKNNWDMGGVANDLGSWVSNNPEDVGNIIGGIAGCIGLCKGSFKMGNEEMTNTIDYFNSPREPSTPQILGKNGESASGIIKNTERIQSATNTAKYRTPDGLNHSTKTISEVKNVKYQSLTSQLRDFLSYSKENGYSFTLYTRENTILSGPLKALIEQGDIIQKTFISN